MHILHAEVLPMYFTHLRIIYYWILGSALLLTHEMCILSECQHMSGSCINIRNWFDSGISFNFLPRDGPM